jgi:asparagine synthase (glutamine-hydrolysing)
MLLCDGGAQQLVEEQPGARQQSIGSASPASAMSGIAAVYRLDGAPVEEMLLDRLLSSIRHRGPDRVGRRIDNSIALGHATLCTTPESMREIQPVCDEDAGLWLTLDGRIDNRDEVAAVVSASGARLRIDTDAELMLRAYECWGDEFPRRIVGDFAFALWDGRKRQLFCARDPGGIKPFYYYFDGRIFVCGSELRQMLEIPDLHLAPNEGFIGEYLCGMRINREESFLKSISRLPPAHWLRVSSEGIVQRRYFDLDPGVEVRYRSDEEYQAHYRDILASAVRSAMRSTTGVAAELSGGMDSSSVVCMAQELLRGGRVQNLPFESFSLVYPDEEYDERRYVEEIAARWGLRANFITPSLDSARVLPERATLHKDVPGYPNGIVYDEIKSLVAKKGFRVLLTGMGGDQWLSGAPRYYADLIRELKLRELWEDLRLNWRFGQPDASRLRNLLQYGIWPLLPRFARRGVKRISGIDEIPRWLRPEFARRINLAERIRRITTYPSGLTFAQQNVYEAFAQGWTVHAFEIGDRDAARFGLEQRHPLYNRRMLEFAFALPDDQRFRGKFTKFIMREAMKDSIPASIRERLDKGNLGSVSGEMLRRLGGERLFESLAVVSLGWVDQAHVAAICRGGLPVNNGAAMWFLWKVLNIELWLEAIFPTGMSARFHAAPAA